VLLHYISTLIDRGAPASKIFFQLEKFFSSSSPGYKLDNATLFTELYKHHTALLYSLSPETIFAPFSACASDPQTQHDCLRIKNYANINNLPTLCYTILVCEGDRKNIYTGDHRCPYP